MKKTGDGDNFLEEQSEAKKICFNIASCSIMSVTDMVSGVLSRNS